MKHVSSAFHLTQSSSFAGFGKVEKRVRTTGGGATGSARNLRIREDTAKYLLNLDPNSAHYDPKSRSMREDPQPYKDPSQKAFAGDNFVRQSGDFTTWRPWQCTPSLHTTRARTSTCRALQVRSVSFRVLITLHVVWVAVDTCMECATTTGLLM